MDGDLKGEERSEYLSSLLGRKVDWREELKLTSGQKARYFAWCNENRVQYLLGSGSNQESTMPQVENKISHPISDHTGDIFTGSIAGIGVDIQKISELFPQDLSAPKADKSLTSIFSLQELSYAESSCNVQQTLTGIFAAKEAIIKSSPSNAKRTLPGIEILHQSDRAPTHTGFQLSISHSGDYAIAVAANLGETVSQTGKQESSEPMNRRENEQEHISLVDKPSKSRLERILLAVRSVILLLGVIGGIWLLIDKLNLFVF